MKIELDVDTVLKELFYTSHIDRAPTLQCICDALQNCLPANYVLHENCVWKKQDFDMFALNEYNLTKYWDAKYKRQQDLNLTPKQKLKLKINELKQQGKILEAAIAEGVLMQMR